MIKNINFGGYSATPDDYQCADGELETAMQVIAEDGHIKNAYDYHTLFKLPVEGKVLYVHEGSTGTAYKHYIVLKEDTNKVGWVDDTNRLTFHEIFSLGSIELHDVNSIGNVLMLLTDDGTQHFLWQNGAYVNLGSKLPSISMDFSLEFSEYSSRDTYNGIEIPDKNNILVGVTDNNSQLEKWKQFSTAVKGSVNSAIAEAHDKGYFIFPFFVRYAIRLNDEAASLVCHSAPVLMLPSISKGVWSFVFYKNDILNVITQVLRAKLQYRFNDDDHLNVEQWKDIIRSVDIFVSAPVYTYDESHDVESYIPPKRGNHGSGWQDRDNNVAGYGSVHSTTNLGSTPAIDLQKYMKRIFSMPPKAFQSQWDNMSLVDLPLFDGASLNERIRSAHDFCLLTSIPIDELKAGAGTRKDITLERDYLSSLVNRERMSDDYDTNDTLLPRYSFVYNQRVNYSDISKIVFNGHTPDSAFLHLDDIVSGSVYVRIRQDAREVWVKRTGKISSNNPLAYFFYPNINADLAVVVVGDKKYKLPLRPHDFLNGACYVAESFTDTDISLPETYNTTPMESDISARTFLLANKLYTSQVGNPFCFPVTNINTIGIGHIIGLSSAVTAVSPGQYGQFPLYVFTSEGVWSLTVNSTGGWETKQVATRDVCINADTITQIDGAVLFATDQGIMLLEGAKSTCISDSIDDSGFSGDTDKKGNVLPGIEQLCKIADVDADSLNLVPFKEYIKDCRMINDYANRRVVVFNPNHPYAYCFNRKGKTWTFLLNNLVSTINSYPESLAIDKDYNVVDVSKKTENDDSSIHENGIIVTRPLKLDAPDILKTVYRVIIHGSFVKSHVGVVLYGSRDLYSWHIIGSSTKSELSGIAGTPYKYFKIALHLNLSEREYVTACTVCYEYKHTNRPR